MFLVKNFEIVGALFSAGLRPFLLPKLKSHRTCFFTLQFYSIIETIRIKRMTLPIVVIKNCSHFSLKITFE